MERPLRNALTLIAIVLIAAPLSLVITILLFPFWSWFEGSVGIESVGHSGPAAWCYLAVFLLLTAAGVLAVLLRQRGERNRAKAA